MVPRFIDKCRPSVIAISADHFEASRLYKTATVINPLIHTTDSIIKMITKFHFPGDLSCILMNFFVGHCGETERQQFHIP
jgi:hypothetical protein